MMLRRIIFTLFFAGTAFFSLAQNNQDSTNKILDEVVITGTKTENSLKTIPMPIQIISAKAIKQSGIENLFDLLQMHTGLTIATNPFGVALQGYPNPFGAGIQMLGMDPAYTLILVDGEPLTGRNAGVLNLGRIALGNIKQIEILRGPATSLYGSDALAGVIHIITQNPQKNALNGTVHYGNNNEFSTSLNGEAILGKTSLSVLGRYYTNDGWDFSKEIYGQTIDPYKNYTLNAKSITRLNDKNTLTFSGRSFSQKQVNNYLIMPVDKADIVKGATTESDKSIFGKWDHKVHEKLNYSTTVYATGFKNHSNAYLDRNDSLYEHISLNQFLLRPEVQVNYGKAMNEWVGGAGYNYERIQSNRYSSDKRMDAWFTYLQKQWFFTNSLNVIVGARYDKNSLYKAQLSPKIAAAIRPNSKLLIKASIGSGFKAPDFRQQFLSLSNSLVGYAILGARELGESLLRLRQMGLLSKDIDITPYKNGVMLSPEKSIGVNVGADYTIKPGMKLSLNIFRNDISNIIETYSLPFLQENGKNIFSYKNMDKIFTQGAELNLNYQMNKNFVVNGGYNFLMAKDKKIIQEIKDQKIYKRDPDTHYSSLVTLKDYKGLYNRSKHTANLNVQYKNLQYRTDVNVLLKYRGKYGFQGYNNYVDGNDILDDEREMAAGYTLMNMIINKEIGKHLSIQTGVDNILDYTEPVLMPYQFGRSYFVNINFKF
ncbi:MAG: TonB-dependent receptor [Chitinophagaceae bacterium]|nr:MAG: TonB-dependent receptor [Chitinophagaceae bacterium]